MRLIGGSDKIEHLRNFIAMIFTTELAKKLSFEGRRGNYKL